MVLRIKTDVCCVSTTQRSRSMLLFALSSVVLLFLFSIQVSAVAIGVNKASITFNDMLRGGYAEEIVTITTDSAELMSAGVIVAGEEASWLNFSLEQFNFSRDAPYQLHIVAQPPRDAQIQSYVVNVSVITGELARSQGGKIGTSTRASFKIPVSIVLTGNEHIACSVGGVVVRDSERGQPVDVQVSVLNRGNVQLNPTINVQVYDQLRSTSLSSRSSNFGSRILPTLTGSVTRQFDFGLSPSQYWAEVRVPECEYAGLFSFDVLEPGGIKDDGDFIRIDLPTWANTGDIVPIKAIFRNKGVRGVRASFKGTVARADNNQIVKVIDSDEYVVDPDVTAELLSYFNPLEGGQYVVAGKVFYNSKLTLERSTIINVNGGSVRYASKGASPLFIVMIIVIIILVLLVLIRRKRRQRY